MKMKQKQKKLQKALNEKETATTVYCVLSRYVFFGVYSNLVVVVVFVFVVDLLSWYVVESMQHREHGVLDAFSR